jgi:hypothetical protein
MSPPNRPAGGDMTGRDYPVALDEQCTRIVLTDSVRSPPLRYQGPGRNSTSPYQARVVVAVLSVSVNSP